jgi:hypothetical protein
MLPVVSKEKHMSTVFWSEGVVIAAVTDEEDALTALLPSVAPCGGTTRTCSNTQSLLSHLPELL